jgi:MarR family transcriptional regulator, lower aerobic nicotinate degradation pathway regulator
MTKAKAAAGSATQTSDELEQSTLDALHQQPGHLVRRCQQLAVAIWAEETTSFDITPVQYAALAAIAAHPGVDATRLSGLIGFDRSTLGDVLDRIQGRGWVKRRAIRTDRRKKTLWLTDEGKELFRHVTPNMYRVQARLMEPLAKEDRAKFIELISRLVGLHTGQARYNI